MNNENVVKVGHRQVVTMIRQGGNHLVLKVVTVTRSLDPDDTARKKGARPRPTPSLPEGRSEQGGGLSPCVLGSGTCRAPHRSPSAGLPVPH